MSNVVLNWISINSYRIPQKYYNNWFNSIFKFANQLDEICGVEKIDALFLGYHARITFTSGGSNVQFPALGILSEGKITMIKFHPTTGIGGLIRDISKEYTKKIVNPADIIMNTGKSSSQNKEVFIIFDIVISEDVKPLYKDFYEECKKQLPNPENGHWIKDKKLEDAPSVSNPTSSSGCYIATTVYGSYNCPQVWTLRRYRDTKLKATWFGRVFTRLYYAISPAIIKLFGQTKWFNKFWRKFLDKKVNKLKDEGYSDTPYND